MPRLVQCPKCQSGMSEGFLLDETYGGRKATRWIEGAPERSIWTGVKIGGRRKIAVTSYRCNRCGYLESYAEA